MNMDIKPLDVLTDSHELHRAIKCCYLKILLNPFQPLLLEEPDVKVKLDF